MTPIAVHSTLAAMRRQLRPFPELPSHPPSDSILRMFTIIRTSMIARRQCDSCHQTVDARRERKKKKKQGRGTRLDRNYLLCCFPVRSKAFCRLIDQHRPGRTAVKQFQCYSCCQLPRPTLHNTFRLAAIHHCGGDQRRQHDVQRQVNTTSQPPRRRY